ncbi:MAG: hypothetical protein BGO26_06935 [Actinobacteria bacterium 69-20]|nr:DNA-protecting protein DprA [Actinomycetota bacterium]OJV30357.1 MAG: hypothetical protein BGO26_06935 [Actinobacteria bacterium 69-20]
MRHTRREIALAGLLRCAEPPVAPAVVAFVDALGAEEAWAAIAGGRAPGEVASVVQPRVGGLGRVELEFQAARDVAIAAENGAVLVGPGDPDWPDELFAPLEWVRPYEQCPHAAPPLALYRRGRGWATGDRGGLAVVGSRAATPYGVRVAAELGGDAARLGRTVVSGAAYGIDAAAHRGALHAVDDEMGDGGGSGERRSEGGPAAGCVATVAVLACGIDRAYPAAHRALIDAIARGGAVISEYPPGSVPARHRFLVRNRLIAALAEATVVVEAGRRSGSLNTATTAANLGRQVFAVPGPVSSAMSVGCHDLIREGRAGLVTGWPDLVGMIEPLAPAAPAHRPGDRPTDGLDLVTSRVHDAIPARGAVSVDTLAGEAALPVPDVMGALAVLQTFGLAQRRDGLWCRA